jgi:hypothetical protein
MVTLTPKMFGVLGVAIAAAGYLCKDAIDAIENSKSALGKELDAYQASSRHESIELNLLSLTPKLEVIEHRVSPSIDYRSLVVQDTVLLKQAEGLVRAASEDLSRLIDKLVFGSASLKEKRKVFQQAVALGGETPTPSTGREKDWTDAAKMKLAIVSTLVVGIPEMVFGDKVITLANKQVKFLGSVVRIGRWLVRVLYLVGACLTGYGIAKGIK